MKTKIFSVLISSVALLIAAGCASVDSRIAKNRAAFNTWPPAVQDKVVRGQIDIGFTRDQVAVALGAPDRVFTRTTSDGTTETWAYRDHGPRFSFGVGIGTFGRHSATSIGIGTSTGAYRDDEKLGVVFDRNGVVSSIETRSR
jgi:outer membrane protein assembly factor BamE (lipoprotein component of BamABCDE complex)